MTYNFIFTYVLFEGAKIVNKHILKPIWNHIVEAKTDQYLYQIPDTWTFAWYLRVTFTSHFLLQNSVPWKHFPAAWVPCYLLYKLL